MADGYWYHGNGKIGGEFCHIKPNDKERYGEYVKVKHGRWKVLASGNDAICTNCEHYWIQNGDQYDYHYCPNCGADMRGGEDG